MNIISKRVGGWYIKPQGDTKWMLLQRFIYQQHYGKISKEQVIFFKDGNNDNFDIDNLVLHTIYDNPSLFKKGRTPWNKGYHYQATGRAVDTQFQKGNVPYNTLEIGEISIQKDKGWCIKVENCKRLIPLSRFNYEKHYGKIPKGHIIVFKDGDIYNPDINNLECISRGELACRNKKKALANGFVPQGRKPKQDNPKKHRKSYTAFKMTADKNLRKELYKRPELLEIYELNQTLKRQIEEIKKR